MIAVCDLQEASIHAPRKAPVVLNTGALQRDRGRVHIRDQLDRMGVAHGQHRQPDHRAIGQVQRPLLPFAPVSGLQASTVKRHIGQVKHRPPHVHGYLPVGLELRLNQSGQGLHPQPGFGAQPAVMHKAGKAARAIAALFNLLAVGVVDQVLKINAWRGRRAH